MITLSPTFREAMVRRVQSNCIVWANTKASLWGNDREHELDEPVRVTDEFPIRLRYSYEASTGGLIVGDRRLSMPITRPRVITHLMIRFYFKCGTFIEFPLNNLTTVSPGETAEIDPRAATLFAA